MKKFTFDSCDRCSAPVNVAPGQIEIYLDEFDETTKLKRVPADLCSHCQNDLIHWFGDYNPRTGFAFEKPPKDYNPIV